jgi:hypothetical protein
MVSETDEYVCKIDPRPDSNFGLVTETLDTMIEKYIESEMDGKLLPVKGVQPFQPEEFRVSLEPRNQR